MERIMLFTINLILVLTIDLSPVTSQNSRAHTPEEGTEEYANRLIREKKIEQVIRKTDKHNLMNCTYLLSDELFSRYWLDMDYLFQKLVVTSDDFYTLDVDLIMDFELFGHKIEKLRLTVQGGIQSTNFRPYWTIYPAPVEPEVKRPCRMKYFDAGKIFAVQWEIGPREGEKWSKKLNFQAVMHTDGWLMFVYKTIPFGTLRNLANYFNVSGRSFGVHYHFRLPGEKMHSDDALRLGCPMEFDDEYDVHEASVLFIAPLPSCSNYKTCESCSTASIQDQCFWCPKLQICSSKEDFLGSVWKSNDCDSVQVSDKMHCVEPEETEYSYETYKLADLELMLWMLLFSIVVIFVSVCFLPSSGR